MSKKSSEKKSLKKSKSTMKVNKLNEQENYENLKKIDELATKIEEEKRAIQRKYKDEIEDKNHTISVLKASENKFKVEIDKSNSVINQLKLELNVLKQEKVLSGEKLKVLTDVVQEYKNKYPNAK